MRRNCILIVFMISMISCMHTDNTRSESDFIGNDDSINLYAFIGQKISVTSFENKYIKYFKIDSLTGNSTLYIGRALDLGFNAKYKVVKNIFNQLESDTIDFVAFDHFGWPEFEKFDTVILYLAYSQNDSSYYHQKYLFDPVKKTKNGNWKGLKGESIKELFDKKKNGELTNSGIF